MVTLLVGSACAANNSAVARRYSHSAKETETEVYKICDGRIEIKPRLKYELAISLRALESAEHYQQLFVPWAQKMRKGLSERTLSDAMTLIENTHEWQLCSLVQDYDGPDTIEGVVDFIRADNDKAIVKWATNNPITKILGITPEQFPNWYADFLGRYYNEGFREQWPEHRKLIYEDANSMAKELESVQISPVAFMEKITGRKFSGSKKLILYPSSFSRPCHGYGFKESGNLVSTYQIGTGRNGILQMVFHELLHFLIRDWWQAERMQNPIAKIANEPLFKTGWEQKGKGIYPYPNYWLDELVVRAVSVYIAYKAGAITEKDARIHARITSYNSYETALYEATFDRYDTFDNIDDFIFYALTYIEVVGEGKDAKFVLTREGKLNNKVN
jgi:hypothetical protein